MKKLLLSVALAAVFSLTVGCGGDNEPEGQVAFVYVFTNKTDVVVTIEAYDGDQLVADHWTLNPGEWLEQGPYGIPYIEMDHQFLDHDTIRIIFGDAREMWIRSSDDPTNPYNLFQHGNYSSTGPGYGGTPSPPPTPTPPDGTMFWHMYFDFTSAMMDDATEQSRPERQ
jgi:hypothetical protein